jgi:hypothetical protein
MPRAKFPELPALIGYRPMQNMPAKVLEFFANFGPQFSENKMDGDFTAR